MTTARQSTGVAASLPANPLRLALTVVLPFGAGYFLANLLRTLNAIVAPHVANDLALSAPDLGLLTAAYFIAFAAAQLPVGIALDRWGAGRVASGLLLVGAAGMVGFAFAHTATELTIARAVIGLGVSGCLMGALKANASCWPAERLPTINSLTAAMGMLGSIASTIPVELAIASVGWRNVLLLLAPAAIAIAVAIHLLVPRDAGIPSSRLDVAKELSHIRHIAATPAFLWLAIPSTLHTGTYLAYQSLWAGPWLRDVAGLDGVRVAQALFAFNLGMLAGTLASGWIAERLARLGVPTVGSLIFGLALSLGTQLSFVLEFTGSPVALCAAFGLFCSTWFLVYSVLSQHFDRAEMGRVNTLLNMMIFVTAFLVQWAVGLVIGLWPPTLEGGFHRQAHQCALAALLALELAGFVVLVSGWLARRNRRTIIPESSLME